MIGAALHLDRGCFTSALNYLQLLALQGNCIFGTLPPELSQLNSLLSLELHENGLSGELPVEYFEGLDNLQLFNVARQYGVDHQCTKSNGTIVNPSFRLGGVVLPRELNTGLTGRLNESIGKWRSMKGLYLFNNAFDGMISSEIGSLRYLTFLRINDNVSAVGGVLV